MIEDGTLLWEASDDRKRAANITDYLGWLAKRGRPCEGYRDLWQWSVQDVPGFWRSIWEYFDVIADGEIEDVLTTEPMPRTRWFTGTRLNYAEHVLRHENTGDPNRPMLHHASELREFADLSWVEVASQVRRLATRLRDMGVKPGDRIVAYMPNIPETVIACLAATAIGAVWSSAAPEFGAQTVIDRFAQIEPTLVFAVNGYRYGGKAFDRSTELQQILSKLPTVTHLVMLDYLPGANQPAFPGDILGWDDMLSGPPVPAEAFAYTRVPSDHPLWVLFTSGTTGLPKPITHGHHGIVLEHYKTAAFHFEIPENGTLFYYSTTGWMVWNTLMWGPLMNGRALLYDGHPAFPDAGLLWDLAAKGRTNVMGLSPSYLQIVRAQGIVPANQYDLSELQTVAVVGSPATPEVFQWVLDNVKSDIWVSSQSGGTEFCSGLLAGSVILPTRAGEIQAPALGVDAKAFDEAGRTVTNAVGELVLEQPIPSMPLCFWGDPDFDRYSASYFEDYPGIWRHGDRAMFNERGGSVVLGRSDATLNRYGVRIGSAEIYRTVESFPEIADSLVVCIETSDGGTHMPLFVQMAPEQRLTDDLRTKIVQRLKTERSPRHVPDVIVETPEIPLTLTGKKMEVPVRRLLNGEALDAVASKDAMRNSEAIDWFEACAPRRT